MNFTKQRPSFHADALANSREKYAENMIRYAGQLLNRALINVMQEAAAAL